MNCKQGDLAIVVRSVAGNEGKIVRCVRWVGEVPDSECPDMWETDTPTKWVRRRDGKVYASGIDCLMPDSLLRPLRGDLLDDETEASKELVHAL